MPDIRKAYVDIGEGQVHYRLRPASGDHGRAIPVVFLHQTASSGAMWEKVMHRWSGAGALYAIDTPGFGGSFDPAGTPDITAYAGWIVETLDALGIDRAHLVGHHTGAVVALHLAATRPDRAESLAMIGPAALTAEERGVFASKLGRAFTPGRSGAHLLMNWEYLRVGGADQDLALLHREMIDMLRAWKARPHAYSAVWALDSTPLLHALACPTVAIAARDDILFPYLDRLDVIRPDIARVVLETGANFEPDLAPDALCAALLAHIATVKST